MPEHPTVLAVHLRDDGFMDGCNHYRFRIPFEALRKNVDGGVFDWAPMAEVRDWAASGRRVKPTDYDMWLLPRFRPLPSEEEGADLPARLKEQAERVLGVRIEGKSHLIDLVRVLKTGTVMVLEYDDDYFTGSRDLNYDKHELLHEFAGEADAITVSTPYLRDLVQRYAPGVPVRVLPNCVNFSEWQGWARWDLWPEDYVTVALTGSRTHEEDWRVLETVLPRIMREFGNVAFLSAGFLPEYLTGLFDKYPDRCLHKGFVPYEAYPGLIRQADVVLAPVAPDDPFNQAKSAIKAVEAMAAGRPFSGAESRFGVGTWGGAVPITSDLYYYRRATGGGKRGLTVEHTPEAWHGAIKALITDEEKRTRLSRKGWAWVHDHRAIERKWRLWWDAYDEIYRRKRR